METRKIALSEWTLLILAFNCMIPLLAHGATYYVAKTGSNSNSCSSAQSPSTAKASIAAGLACLSGGDTLIIKAGTYAEYIQGVPAGLGTSARTTLRSAPGETVVIRPTTGGAGGDAVWISRSYILLDGLIIDAANVSVQGIRINSGASYVRIQNSEVKNARNSNCLGIQDASSNFVEIINSKFHHCGSTELHHGVYLRGSNHLVERSEVFNISGYGVHQWNSHSFPNDANVVRYNHIHDNGNRAMIIGSGKNNMAHNNIVRHNGTLSGQGEIQIAYNNPDNNMIYHNTVYANRGYCMVVVSGTANTKIKNNFCLSNTSNTISNSGTGTILSKNRMSTDLTLVEDAANNRFTPRQGSGLIDAGEIISGFSAGRYAGAAPDQGGIEASFSATTSVPTAPANLQVSP